VNWLQVLKKIGMAFLIVFVITTIVFFLAKLIPGSPYGSLDKLSNERLTQLNEAYGFDKPIYEQYFRWLGNAFRGDFGDRIFFNTPVVQYEQSKVMNSFTIGFFAVVIGVIVGIFFGLIAGIKQNKLMDNFIVLFIIIISSLPMLVLAPVIQNGFKSINIQMGEQIIPTSFSSDNNASLIAPIITLAVPIIVLMTRYTRAETIQHANSTFVQFAKAKGLKKDSIVFEQILPNTLVSTLTFLPGLIMYMLVGSFVVEVIFSVDGLASEMVEATANAEYFAIAYLTMIFATISAFSYLLTDILYSFVDPRIRIGGKHE
jgi:oligopeptide transport system permease protein